jgi:tetratricopeptide (TPR) repeat protein
MFMARHERSARHPSARTASGRKAPDRKALRRSTLERRYDFHLSEAIRAALQGSHDKAAGHSGQALLISRELCAEAADPARHQPELAAALCAHARYGGGAWAAIAMLTESAGHYAALAEADPAAYEVPRIDVLTRIALASDAAGSTQDAISLLHEVVGMYLKAPAADQEERDLSLARARFHLGNCLLRTGLDEDGLAETEAGLELAADVLDRLQLPGDGRGWLAEAPRYVQLAAPDWAAAAVRSMTLHAEAGRWQQAATAARAAILVSGGLAELGGDTLRDAHEKISARAGVILAAVIARGDDPPPCLPGGTTPPKPPDAPAVSHDRA